MTKKEKIIQLISEENKEQAVLESLSLLEENKIGIVELYEDVLKHALYQIECAEFDKECIWKEHIKTSIVRTIIETTYPYILKERKDVDKKNKSVLVVCPSEEYHEIGALMVHNYFELQGYNSTFIGANTPLEVIKDAATYTKVDYVALSVTNFYNTINTKKIISELKTLNKDLQIILGGQAFLQKEVYESMNADFYIDSFESIGDIK